MGTSSSKERRARSARQQAEKGQPPSVAQPDAGRPDLKALLAEPLVADRVVSI